MEKGRDDDPGPSLSHLRASSAFAGAGPAAAPGITTALGAAAAYLGHRHLLGG